MEEKIIIEGQYNFIGKLKGIILRLVCIDVILGVISLILYSQADYYCGEAHKFNIYYMYDSEPYKIYQDLSKIMLYFLIPFVIFLVITIFVGISYISMKKTELVITNKRAYGRVLWGKRVDLPLDSISTIATTANIFKGICIATSSGKIVFYCISNRDEIHKEINKLLIDRQNTNNNIPVQNSSNNIDDVLKLKEMLDMGILSQEEFEAKKKQLLGL